MPEATQPSDTQSGSTDAHLTMTPAARRRVVFAGAVGSAVEYYDYGVYGYLAITLAALFFPAGDPTAALLATFAVFAVSFVARPLGGVILGHIGDKLGRRTALAAAVLVMSVGTFGIGILPTYQAIGVAAPLLLVAARLIQGLSAGGENPGAGSFVAEISPPGRRGLLCSMPQVGSMVGLLLASALIGILSQTLSESQLHSWGWRIPFLLALPFGVIGLYVRMRLEDSPAFRRVEASGDISPLPLVDVVLKAPGAVLRTIGVTMLDFAGYYIVFVYLTTYLERQGGFSSAAASWSTSSTLIAATITIPLFGALSDRIGRKRTIALSAVAFLVLTVPMFLVMQSGNIFLAVLGQVVLGVCVAAIMGPLFATLSEVFATRVRYTGFALGFNIGAIAAGGTAPYVATWLIDQTGTALSPAFFLMATAAITLLTVLTFKESARTSI